MYFKILDENSTLLLACAPDTMKQCAHNKILCDEAINLRQKHSCHHADIKITCTKLKLPCKNMTSNKCSPTKSEN